MPEEQIQNPVSLLLAEFGTRLNEVEEKQRLIRDRALLIGENLISTKKDLENQNFELKKKINEMNQEIKVIKKLVHRIVNELPNLAKKSELDILENQSKIFQPLELVRTKDIEAIIEDKLRAKLKKIQ